MGCATTVIRAAGQREVGSEARKLRFSDGTDAANFALVLRFPRDLLESRFSCKVFHANLTQERSHCSGVTLGR